MIADRQQATLLPGPTTAREWIDLVLLGALGVLALAFIVAIGGQP